jgi:putative endonuclease
MTSHESNGALDSGIVQDSCQGEDAQPKPYYLYVVECSDGSWYTGYTDDVARRIATHNAGAGAKYTRSRRPVKLVASARFSSKYEAMSAEYRFKRLSRDEKERLVSEAARTGEPLEEVLARELLSGH